MWRRAITLVSRRQFSTEPEFPSLYSFLQPSIFSRKSTPPPSPNPHSSTPKTLTPDHISALETALETSLADADTDEAWKSFKSLTNASNFPSKSLANSLITHLSSLHETHNLKRAFASTVFVLEKNPELLEHQTVVTLLNSMKIANTGAPALALVKSMFKNRFFVPFNIWGNVLVEISRKNGSFVSFLQIFRDNCRIALDEKLDFMKPDLEACNAALEGCCRELESVSDANNVIESMSLMGVHPNELSFGFLSYLYALKGLEEKIIELESLMNAFGFSEKTIFLSNLISGYVKSGNLESVSTMILRCLREGGEQGSNFSEETYREVVRGVLEKGSIKDLANLIIEAQKLEPPIEIERSIGYGIVSACVDLGLLDKAHSILDEMNAKGGTIGLGVYVSILKAYCKERRTAEASQLVTEITNSALQLDVATYDSLIEASISSQDFQSAFSMFMDMREARAPDLKSSYLTIMTGLTENHRPELMAAFLDEIVGDPRISIGTHDWNSIIHAFCKAGRVEDAKRTFRRMIFLRFEPNEQTYLSLINGYVNSGKNFSVLMLWSEVKKRVSIEGEKKALKLDHGLVDAFLYALVKGGFFDAVMEVVEKSQEMRIFVDKWRYKQAFMENHKKLKVSKLRKRNFRKMEALIAFKNWVGLHA